MRGSMAPAQKTYNINVTINVKRGKEEVDFARTETEKLYGLIGSEKHTDWAKDRIESIHEMIFLPPADKIKDELTKKLEEDTTSSSN